MTFNTQTPIANGDGYEDVKSRLVTLAETWLGAGQASGGNDPATWADMRAKLNLILTAFGKPAIGASDSGATSRSKINGIIDAEALLAGVALAWWNADRADLITLSGAQVTSFKDSYFAYDAVQAVSGARPTYSATGFNGKPSLAADGVDDELTLASMPFPSGAAPSIMRVVVQQDALPADTTARNAFSVGNLSTTGRLLGRSVVSGANRSRLSVGDGSAAAAALGSVVDLSGRHMIKGVIGGTSSDLRTDKGAPTNVVVVPATATNRTRLFAAPNSTATGFWNGKGRDWFISAGETTDQANYIDNFFLSRRAL